MEIVGAIPCACPSGPRQSHFQVIDFIKLNEDILNLSINKQSVINDEFCYAKI